ncbi:MAG: Natural resistance-associated macrophage protein [candidate division CPR2 bacterium GW2011_GWC1_41_48]|uniref:Natural resistance-associated macrophage protein n=1 Tax=candidate division CPR2 bacterium GW2011_GWC1_41_48 TaxID=1618344 RepID=A0A0G0W9L8_UNCC2|nr:MAG: Natural resistance-associated macrophage protein [candidate division CPR2 bacterium GW2011_GWC2_39_35]KKS08752.1 MAG: Natural resistance-associated macrophage protein [candidate division CPR2 bacterium GW2011_GWC1_41_48]
MPLFIVYYLLFCYTQNMEEKAKKIIDDIENAPKSIGNEIVRDSKVVTDEIIKDTRIVAGGIATGTKAVAGEIAKDTKMVVEGIEKAPQVIVETLKRPAHFSLKIFLKKLGPGLITGASDDDPSGVATYSYVGARFGYQQLWLSLYLLPLMTAVQEICARIGLVTDEGLAGTVKKHYGKKLVIFVSTLLLFANIVNIGANLGAMTSSTRLLIPNVNFTLILIAYTVIVLLLVLFVRYHTYSKILKFLVISLGAYIATGIITRPDWSMVLKSALIPQIQFNKDFLMAMVAVMGTTITPYLFFWQTSEEVEEHIEKHLDVKRSKKVELAELADMREDVFAGMGLANLVFFFIIVTTASVLFTNGITNIETAQDAAMALRPLAGDHAYLLFATGIIATGFLSIPVLAGSVAYAVSETFDWNEGLYHKFKEAKGFYGIIILATIVGLIINYIGISPFKALIYAAVVNGIIAPILLFTIMVISNDKKIMGDFVNSRTSNFFGWLATILMGAAAATLILSMVF